MKRFPKSMKVLPVLLIVLLLALTPILGIGCGNNGPSDEMNLIFQSPYPETDVTGLAAQKFKELLEDKTDGKVTVELNYGGILMPHQNQLEGLAAGSVDVVIEHPGYARFANPNFDFSGTLQGLMTTKAHFNAVASNSTYLNFIEGLYNDKGVHFVGYLETFIASMYFSNTEIDSLYDFQGKKLYTGRAGTAEPIEAMLGAIRYAPTSAAEVAPDIASGKITLQATQVTYAAALGDYTNWDYGLVRFFYAPNEILISKAKWDSMSTELQDLISNEIFPEVANYTSGQVVQAHKDALKKLVDNLTKVHVVSVAEENQVWSELEVYPAFVNKAATMDQTILELIKDKRPTTTQFGADEKAILNFAGVQY